MPKTVTRIGLYSTLVFSLAITACSQSKSAPIQPQAANVNVPNPFEQPNKTVEDPNGDRAKPVNVQKQQQYDMLDGVDPALKQTCAVDICGPLNASKLTADDIYRGRVETTDATKQIFNEKIKPLLESKIAIHQQKKQVLGDAFTKRRTAIEAVQLNSDYTKLINAIWITKYISAVLACVNDEGQFDDAKIAAVFASFSDLDRQFLKLYTKEFVESAYFADLNYLQSVSFDDMLKVKYQTDDRTQLAALKTTYAKNLNDQIIDLKKRFPGLPLNESRGLRNLVRGNDVEPLKLAELPNDVVLAIVNELSKKDDFGLRPLDLSQQIQKFYSKLAVHFGNSDQTDAQAKLFATCQLTIDQLTAMNLTQADVSNFNNITQAVRTTAKKELNKFASDPAALQSAAQAIDQIDFNMPSTTEQRLANLGNLLREEMAEEKLETLKTAKLSDADLALLAYITGDQTDNGIDGISSVCQQSQPDPISDFTLSGHGKIYVSWQTVKFPDTGAGVLAHEFGHVVSGALKPTASSQYVLAKQCTADRHGTQDGRTDSDEEDFADVFAASVMNELTTPQINTGCLIVGNTGDQRYGDDYGLSLIYPSNFGDSHSPSFYRMVQQEIERGRKLTDACQAVVEKGLPSMNQICAK